MNKDRLDFLFMQPDYEKPHLCVCVGSWKAYNECNEHGLGSRHNGSFYIDFLELEGADELREVLEAIGWSEAEQEETFVQDYESNFDLGNCDRRSAFELADFVYDHITEISDDADKIEAIQDVNGGDFEEAVENADDYIFYADVTGPEYERQYLEETATDIPDWLWDYIDYEALWRNDETSGCADEVNGGVLITC